MASSQRIVRVTSCSACLRAAARQAQARALPQSSPCASPGPIPARPLTSTTRLRDNSAQDRKQDSNSKDEENKEQGALSRRLQEMAEETINSGSASDRRTLQSTPGFSADLKDQLEQRIAESAFKAENQQVLGEVTIPRAAGKGTREQAAAQPWEGNEALSDSALRMLDDSHKRIRMPARKPTLASTGTKSLKPSVKRKISAADRLANARDKTSVYALTREQQSNMSEEEKAAYKKELRDRFSPGARPMPTTLQGLTSLANERIEDAIARGQFRNIQRGKGVNIERDYTANSPFLDTTEYFMNKIIQKQEIVPPWIEKQQELVKLVNTFRKRLRNDWRRHAARMIASTGGTVADQVRRAKGYALAEEVVNPRPKVREEEMTTIDATGMLSTVTIEEKIAAGVAVEEPPAIEIKVTEKQVQADPDAEADAKIVLSEEEDALIRQMQQHGLPSPDQEDQETLIQQMQRQAAPGTEPVINTATIQIDPAPPAISEVSSQSSVTNGEAPAAVPPPAPRVLPMPYPFRDPDWEKAESAYHNLAINEINALARSYNLMAPKIARKPYYNLDRELKRCYAETAPLLADEILERSRKPVIKVAMSMHKPGGVMERFGAGKEYAGHQTEKIRDEAEEKGYGFKQFWRDLFSKEDKTRERV